MPIQNNKRIAKNTIYLYGRMLVSMLLSVYTSRLVLQALGETDFGIYNVVGGVVVLLNFLNGTLVASTQRFINYSIGEKNVEKTGEIYRAATNIHFLLSLIVFIIAETIGLWLVNTVLTIPNERLFAANVIYQFSIITICFTINTSPSQAMVIAQESMGYYAIFSIFDTIARFVVALALVRCSSDRLIIYGASFSVIGGVDYLLYTITCRNKFQECKSKKKIQDRNLYKQMISFSGWALIGSISNTASNQGINILLNVFSGPVVNAARGLAMTLNGYVYAFVSNFTVAFSPQLVKLYAANEYTELYKLLLRSIKYSIFMFGLIALPVLFETNFILKIWLKNVPQYTPIFCQIIIFQTFLSCAERPMATVCNAIGCVKQINLSVGLFYFLAFIISWILLFISHNVVLPFIINAIAVLGGIIMFLYYITKYIKTSKSAFASMIFYKCILTFLLPIIALTTLIHLMTDGWARFILVFTTSTLLISFSVFVIGLDNNEKNKVKHIIANKLCIKR